MACLYAAYITLNAVLSVVLGKVFDNDMKKTGNILKSLVMVGGYVCQRTAVILLGPPTQCTYRVHFSVASAIILISTFVPRGAFSLNPEPLRSVLPKRRPAPQHLVELEDLEDLEKKTEFCSFQPPA